MCDGLSGADDSSASVAKKRDAAGVKDLGTGRNARVPLKAKMRVHMVTKISKLGMSLPIVICGTTLFLRLRFTIYNRLVCV